MGTRIGLLLGLLLFFCSVPYLIRAAPSDTAGIPDAPTVVPGTLVPTDGLGVRILSHSGEWTSFFSMSGGAEPILLINGQLENTSSQPLTYVKLQFELLGEDNVIYREKLLFQKCQWNLSIDGRKLLEKHFHISQKYAEAISRIQIEGHADRRSPKNCETLQQVGLRRDNWILSSLRALEVRDLLETIIKQDLEKTSEGASRGLQAALPTKLEAVGRGDLHPINPVDPDDEANRQIEITVHFIEQRASEAGPPPLTETESY